MSVPPSTHYMVLGVAHGAETTEIKTAWRMLAHKYHPDVCSSAGTDLRMAAINVAYETLIDPVKRAAYDAFLYFSGRRNSPRERPQRPVADAGWREGFEFSTDSHHGGGDKDLFEQNFSEAVLRRHTPQNNKRRCDQHATIELSLKEAYEGVYKTILLHSDAMDSVHRNITAYSRKVAIPKGAFEGQNIRIAGRSEPGNEDSEDGDLLIKVKFKHDVHWRTVGRNVYGGPVLLAPWEAALGARTKIRTPTGEAEVTIPPDWKPGRTLRLKGRGIPAGAPTSNAGDLYIELAIALPPADGAVAREAYAALARAFPAFTPRASSP